MGGEKSQVGLCNTERNDQECVHECVNIDIVGASTLDTVKCIFSKMGKAVLLPDEANHDEEKMLEPKGFDMQEGNVVSELERRQPLCFDNTEDEATHTKWHNAGRREVAGVVLDWGRSCSCLLNDSVDIRVLEPGVEELTYC